MALADLPYDELRQVFLELDYEEAKRLCQIISPLSVDSASLSKDVCADPAVWAERATLRLGITSETFRNRSWLEEYLPLPEGPYWGQMRYAEVVSRFGVVSDSDHFLTTEEMIYRVAKDHPNDLALIEKLVARVHEEDRIIMKEVIVEQAALNGNYLLFQKYLKDIEVQHGRSPYSRAMATKAVAAGGHEDINVLYWSKYCKSDQYEEGRIKGGWVKTYQELEVPSGLSNQVKVRVVIESGNVALLEEIIKHHFVTGDFLTTPGIMRIAGRSGSLGILSLIKDLYDRYRPDMAMDDFVFSVWEGALGEGDIEFLDRLYQVYPLPHVPVYYISTIALGHYTGPVLEWVAGHFELEVLKDTIRYFYQDAMNRRDEGAVPDQHTTNLAAKAFFLSLRPLDFVPRPHTPEDED